MPGTSQEIGDGDSEGGGKESSISRSTFCRRYVLVEGEHYFIPQV